MSRSDANILGIKLTALVLATVLLLWLATLAACHGRFLYALDDPYISLSFADHIWHGQYGLNTGELSSPASSVLYPLMLAALHPLGFGVYAPLLVNLVAATLICLLLAEVAWRQGLVTQMDQVGACLLALFLICLAIDAIGLVFVGLEHTVHMLVSMLIIVGIAKSIDRHAVPSWLPPLIVTVPLWRFEGVALAGLAVAGLYVAGKRKAACYTAVATLGILAAYGLTMRAYGLPLLPSSVLAKWSVVSTTASHPLSTALHGLSQAAGSMESWPLIAVGIMLVARTAVQHSRNLITRDRVLVAIYLGMLTAHLCFGAWSWFMRYTPYLAGTAAIVFMYVYGDFVRAAISGSEKWRLRILCVGIVIFGRSYITYTVCDPLQSRSVYDQQYQMRRFALDYYKKSVAVNDIGEVSFGNPNYVLDLWGITSEETRMARTEARPGWMHALVVKHDVGLAMIYDSWFPDMVPPEWRRMAILTDTQPLAAGGNKISFYATSIAAVPDVLHALKEFAPSVPEADRLALYQNDLNAPKAADAAR